MKSAEEWAKELQPVLSHTREVEDRYSETPHRIHVYKDVDKEAVIKQIQLDAWREGMTDASEALFHAWRHLNLSPRQCEDVILAVRDKKTTL